MTIPSAPIVGDLDRPRTFKEAADTLGLPYFKIQRAARTGVLPTYRIFNGRRYVKLRDIIDIMTASAV